MSVPYRYRLLVDLSLTTRRFVCVVVALDDSHMLRLLQRVGQDLVYFIDIVIFGHIYLESKLEISEQHDDLVVIRLLRTVVMSSLI